MPKLTGLFDSFDNLDAISPEMIASWLKPVPPLAQLENYLANRILYPQTLPQTPSDIQIDLAILREALKRNGPDASLSKPNALLGGNPFLNITLRKLLIPQEFLNFVPDLAVLTFAFIDALLLGRKNDDWFEDVWTVVLTGETEEVAGSLIIPRFEGSRGVLNFNLLGKNYQIRPGSLTIIPCLNDRCRLVYKIQNGKVLGRAENAVEVYGGRLGLMFDGRRA